MGNCDRSCCSALATEICTALVMACDTLRQQQQQWP
jgi:hypothetical protein